MFFDFYCLKSGYKYLHAVTFNSNVSSSVRWISVFSASPSFRVSFKVIFVALFFSFLLTQTHTLFTPCAWFRRTHTQFLSLLPWFCLSCPFVLWFTSNILWVCFFFVLFFSCTTALRSVHMHVIVNGKNNDQRLMNTKDEQSKHTKKKNDKNTTNKKPTRRELHRQLHTIVLSVDFLHFVFDFMFVLLFSLSLLLVFLLEKPYTHSM